MTYEEFKNKYIGKGIDFELFRMISKGVITFIIRKGVGIYARPI